MCGIAGIIDFEGQHPIDAWVRRMTETIRHRGPDDEGFALFSLSSYSVFGGDDTPESCYAASLPFAPQKRDCTRSSQPPFLALGHRRLSIIDITPSGHQPMCYDDNNFWIVFNGEVYNYLELRAELESLGHSFISSSDTEVVMASYKEWGKACLPRFNGMFSLLLYDRRRNTIFAARDRFGVKPFYYWRSPAGFLAIASEIKQFIGLPGWNPRINNERTLDFLATGITDHTEETLFKDVFQLPGGQYFECPIDHLQQSIPIKKWYNLIDSIDPSVGQITFSEASERFYSLFEDAVKLRLRSDVPVGTGLSGGLDSSSIVCMVWRLLRDNPESKRYSFSACTEEKRIDERPFIEEVVRRTGVSSLYTFPSTEQFFSDLPGMIWHQEEPFPTASIFAEWCVFNLVSTTPVKVTLDGHGADEILAGYHSFYETYFTSMIKKCKILSAFKEMSSTSYSKPRILKGFLRTLLPTPLLKLARFASGRSPSRIKWIDLNRMDEKGTWDWIDYTARSSKIQDISIDQLLRTSLPKQLHWCDRDSMAHSIESRAPFLDYRIVEFLIGCDDSCKIHNASTKRILRNAMSKLLPAKIRDRKDKIGFEMPEARWFQGNNALKFHRAFTDAVQALDEIINPEGANRLFQTAIAGKYDSAVWRIVTLGAWTTKFNVSK